MSSSWSVAGFTAQSHSLELTILRSRLDAATSLLEREQERSRHELESLRAQISTERNAYQAYIKSLEEALGRM
jgi:hypothetical protein